MATRFLGFLQFLHKILPNLAPEFKIFSKILTNFENCFEPLCIFYRRVSWKVRIWQFWNCIDTKNCVKILTIFQNEINILEPPWMLSTGAHIDRFLGVIRKINLRKNIQFGTFSWFLTKFSVVENILKRRKSRLAATATASRKISLAARTLFSVWQIAVSVSTNLGFFSPAKTPPRWFQKTYLVPAK